MNDLTITSGKYYGLFASTSAAEAVLVVTANGAVYLHGRLVPQTDAEMRQTRDAFNPNKHGAWDAPASEEFAA